MAGTLRLGRKRIRVEDGDSVASALYRAGIRTFSRSLKYHRRRGLYCGTGECPNCLVTVDGIPGVRSCVTPAADGMRVRRERGWPSVERDALAILDRLHVLLPVGFYYKTFIHPRWSWAVAYRMIRRAVGLGRLPGGPVVTRTNRHLHCDVLVVGAGESGRAAASSAAVRGERVVLCDEGDVAERPEGVEVLARHAAIGVYDGPMVALASGEGIVQVHPRRVVMATGGSEVHPVFPGNDLPGVMLGRAAVGLAKRGVAPGRRAVVVAGHDEGIEHLTDAPGRRRPDRGRGRPLVARGAGAGRRQDLDRCDGRACGGEGPGSLRGAPGCRRRDPGDRLRSVRPLGGPVPEGRPRPDERRGRGRARRRRRGGGSGDGHECSSRGPCACAKTCPWGTWSVRGRRGSARRSS